MKQLAICFYGQPRFLQNKVVHDHYINCINKYDADVYIHSWITGTETIMNSSDWSKHYNFVEEENCKDKILDMYSPKEYLFEKPKELKLDEKTRQIVKNLQYYSLNNEVNLLSHLTSLSSSVNLIETPEKYKFILCTRLDAYFYDFPDLYALNDGFYLDGQWTHFTDGVMLFSSKYINGISKIIDHINDTSNNIGCFTSEEYVKHNLNLFSIVNFTYSQQFKAGYVRSNDGLNLMLK